MMTEKMEISAPELAYIKSLLVGDLGEQDLLLGRCLGCSAEMEISDMPDGLLLFGVQYITECVECEHKGSELTLILHDPKVPNIQFGPSYGIRYAPKNCH